MPPETNVNLVVFTDLDGTLLDHANYQWSAAQPALEELARRGVPLVMVSSKSRIEILSLLRNFGRRDPFVVENGGAIYVPVRYFPFAIEEAELSTGGWWRISLGTPYRKLVEELEAAARAVEVRVLGFSQMSPSELADFAEFGIADARRALQREFDEAFLIVSGDQRAWPRLAARFAGAGCEPPAARASTTSWVKTIKARQYVGSRLGSGRVAAPECGSPGWGTAPMISRCFAQWMFRSWSPDLAATMTRRHILPSHASAGPTASARKVGTAPSCA